MPRLSITDVMNLKGSTEPFSMLTAYDYHTAKLADKAGIPILLVGDSLGMVVLGYDSTVQVTIQDMVHHTKPVVRGSNNAMIVTDMPFMSYHGDHGVTMANAARLIQEGGAGAVKVEGGKTVCPTITALANSGIPVMSHIGLTPQSVHALGGFKLQGNTLKGAKALLEDAQAVEAAGAFAVVLELVPAELSKMISERLTIPTIGIGAGPNCDGQVQVAHDILGLSIDYTPRHALKYADSGALALQAFKDYKTDVSSGKFPSKKNFRTLDPSVIEQLS
ncbi:MAG: 3-methyl-2-oxobutanoate hydroxymethyltransferase [SAR202 cluster bacterium]|nr:3-methyl-2-oxobutanoate hydroxymethyltransferase [SAR202 cluster bacterium]|tara:strand:+ start:735 stop:1565 length:831 start_codon:yes stop_codon:yes gene_type:complete